SGGVYSSSAADEITRYGYDAYGRQVYAIDPAGDVTQTTYDSLGEVVAVEGYTTPLTSAQLSSANLSVTSMAADSPSALSAVISADVSAGGTSGRIAGFAYDGAGRRVFAVDAAGDVTRTVYSGGR